MAFLTGLDLSGTIRNGRRRTVVMAHDSPILVARGWPRAASDEACSLRMIVGSDWPRSSARRVQASDSFAAREWWRVRGKARLT